MPQHRWVRLLGGVCLAMCGLQASAHDTWFQPLPSTPAGHLVFGSAPAPVFRPTSSRSAMNTSSPAAAAARARRLRGWPMSRTGPLHWSCAAPRRSRRLTVSPAGPSSRPSRSKCRPTRSRSTCRKSRPAGGRARDLGRRCRRAACPGSERYTKYARIELGGVGPRRALPLGMDVLLRQPACADPRRRRTRASRCCATAQPLADLAGRAGQRASARSASGAHRRRGPRPRRAAAGRPLDAARHRPARVEQRPPTTGRAAS